jgi:hypothetical protein
MRSCRSRAYSSRGERTGGSAATSDRRALIQGVTVVFLLTRGVGVVPTPSAEAGETARTAAWTEGLDAGGNAKGVRQSGADWRSAVVAGADEGGVERAPRTQDLPILLLRVHFLLLPSHPTRTRLGDPYPPHRPQPTNRYAPPLVSQGETSRLTPTTSAAPPSTNHTEPRPSLGSRASAGTQKTFSRPLGT